MVCKRGNSRCELHIGGVKIKQIRNFTYLRSVITDNGKYDIIIQRLIGITKRIFLKRIEKIMSGIKDESS